MSDHDVAFVGTGANPDEPSVDGFAMAYRHAQAYDRLPECRLVGCADLVPENAAAFAGEYGIPDDGVFEDYTAMVRELEPDVVSVCTPPATHADLVTGVAETGVVDAIHCEKPMSNTWGESRRMARVCADRGIQLTFNHQRRFGDPFRHAKALIDEGAIGDLRRVEYSWGDFYDNGTHAIDMCNYFVDADPVWVIGQLDYRERDVRFGTHNENQMFASWRYDDGVYGMASTGPGDAIAEGDWRLIGSEGRIDVHLTDELSVRVSGLGTGVERVATFDSLAPGSSCIDRAIADVIDALDRDRPSELRAENALRATEIIFAGYESARRRGRVDLPLEIDDNPLETMLESGELSPAAGD